MAVASAQGFIGGTNASPSIALHPQGLSERGGGCPSSATAHTLTADSGACFKIASPASAINQDLPTTNVKAGKRFTLIVTGATETNYVALRSSAGNEIDRIGGDGVIEVVALQDAPTSSSHWKVVNLVEEGVAFTATATGANTNNVSFVLNRVNKVVSLTVQQAGTSSAGGTSITMSAIPTRFRPATQRYMCGLTVNNSANQAGMHFMNTTGVLISSVIPAASYTGTCAVFDGVMPLTYSK